MNNLFILGNGFDLSHGMETRYDHFLNYIFEEHIKEESKFNKLLNIPKSADIQDLDSFLTTFEHRFPHRYLIPHDPLATFKEEELGCNFIGELISKKIIEGNWSDIEELYFQIINKADTQYLNSINTNFENFKIALQEYLRIQESKSEKMDSYTRLFTKLLSTVNSMVVNFNYTNTFEKLYMNDTVGYNKKNTIHIHGELFDELNPIVFGYAADDDEVGILLDKGNNYLANIKRHQYKNSNQERKVKEYLNKTEDINLFIIGHSCGLSDKLILNQILNHPNIISIHILYYENRENYFDSHINIYRISNKNNDSYDKVVNFIDSHRIPQIYDRNENLKSLDEFISKAYDTDKRLATPKSRGVTSMT